MSDPTDTPKALTYRASKRGTFLDDETLEYSGEGADQSLAPPSDKVPRTEQEGAQDTSPQGLRQIASRYEIMGLLGSGGMGNVYKVRDMALDEIVALKTLHASLNQNEHALKRFRREVKLARRVTHPNVARTFDLGTDAQVPYLTMEFVQGETLYTRLDKLAKATRRLDLTEVITLAIEIARGLDAAHKAGVIHRDLKPANIILTEDGRAVITDFGIARINQHNESAITALDGIIGTPLYMSPEQVEGTRDIDHRTDLYALGVMIFEMVCGRAPFQGDSPMTLALARVLHDAPSLEEEGYPAALSKLVAKLLERDVAKRFAHAQSLIEALTRLRDSLSSSALPAQVKPSDGQRVAPQFAYSSGTYKPQKACSSDKAVAILPLRQSGIASEEGYIAEGFLEELIGELSVVPKLRVRPLGVVKSLVAQSDERDPTRLGAKLEVDVVITGSIRGAGEKLRIRLALVSVREGFQLWGEKFITSRSELFVTAEDAAEAIAATLTSQVEEERRPEPITDPVAIDAYMQGRYLLQHKWFEGVDEALSKLKVARDRAPEDPRILTTMATAMARQVFFEPQRAALLLEQAKAHATRAAEIAPSWPEPSYAMAMIAYAAGDYATTATSCQRALELDPEHIEANDLLGRVLAEVGPLKEARYHLELALSLNDTLSRAWWDLARVYALLGDWEKVDTLKAHVRRTSSNPATSESILFRFYAWQRLPFGAFEFEQEMEVNDARFDVILEAIRTFVRDGRLSEAQVQRLQARARELPAKSQTVRIFLQLCTEFALISGCEDLAYRSAEAALNEGLRDLMWLQHMPLFDPVRAQPRFKRLLQQAQMMLAPVRATITPYPHHS